MKPSELIRRHFVGVPLGSMEAVHTACDILDALDNLAEAVDTRTDDDPRILIMPNAMHALVEALRRAR